MSVPGPSSFISAVRDDADCTEQVLFLCHLSLIFLNPLLKFEEIERKRRENFHKSGPELSVIALHSTENCK